MNWRKVFNFVEAYLVLPLALLLFSGLLWCIGAIYYTLPLPRWQFAGLFWGMVALLVLGMLYRRAWWSLLVIESGIVIYFVALTPQVRFKNVEWQTSWREMPQVEISGDDITVRKVRDFEYESENNYEVRYRTLKLKKSHLESLDILFSHWDNLEPVAHTMLRFNFKDDQALVVSMETRLPQNVEQGFLPGIYKQYQIIMLLGTARDLIGLRTDYRGETVYSYRIKATSAQQRKILNRVLQRAQELRKKPEFYNSITENCTTSLVPMLRMIKSDLRHDIRLLLNGYSDKLLFESDYLECRKNESFGSLKARSLLPGKSHGED